MKTIKGLDILTIVEICYVGAWAYIIDIIIQIFNIVCGTDDSVCLIIKWFIMFSFISLFIMISSERKEDIFKRAKVLPNVIFLILEFFLKMVISNIWVQVFFDLFSLIIFMVTFENGLSKWIREKKNISNRHSSS